MNIVKYYTTDKKLIKSLVKKYQKKYTQNSLAHKLNVKIFNQNLSVFVFKFN